MTYSAAESAANFSDTSGSKIETKYRARTKRSLELTSRAERVMPGGETRSGVYHPPYSLTLERGKGARCWDVDGNEYLDLANNYTCLVHGHAFEPIVTAAKKAVEKGTTWTAKVIAQTELAELLVGRVEAVDQVRFTNSGTEAVLAALALARACTGRKKMLFARYAYHGHLLETSSQEGAWLDCYLGEFGNAESFEKILDEHGSEIAGVMLEPVLGLGGAVSAPTSFFERVQAAAKKAGALFMLDEATVFRVAVGGAQQLLGIRPDLSVLGKYVGGGFPCGVIGGTNEVMAELDPRSGNCHLSGTFSGNPVSMAAGVAAVQHFTESRVTQLTEQITAIESALTAAAKRHGLPFCTRRYEGLMNAYFSDELPPVNQLRDDDRLASLFQLACLANGIFIVSRIMINTSTAMGDAELNEVIQRLEASLADVAAEA